MGELGSKGSSCQALATLPYSQRSGKVRWEMSDPRNWDLKPGRTKAQEV